jgi:hypothetical protein
MPFAFPHFAANVVKYGAFDEPITDAYVLFSKTSHTTWSYFAGAVVATPHGVVADGSA